MISNGDRTELSPIVITRVITKSDDRTARVRFVYTISEKKKKKTKKNIIKVRKKLH